LDHPKSAAIIHAHIAVIIPWSGVAPLATAREIDRGIEIILTANPDCRFLLRSLIKLFMKR
jgi:hypothetical protein